MSALNPGAVVAGYRIERMLGRGGMGDVYLARHPRLPRYDALKLMSQELSRSSVFRQRFNSEADLACQVAHDAVVRVYDRGEDGDRLWLAMEYVDGRDLSDILESEGRLAPQRAVALVQRVAAGLDAIHARGLLHRDVKPANILVTRDPGGGERALLTDFGIARSAADSLGLTSAGDIVATLHYAAPEQFEMRSGDLDRRVDVYALGCVLYELLTGTVPLEGDTVAAFWSAMQTQTPVPPSKRVPGLPVTLDAVLEKALCHDRDKRYSTAGELANAAAAALRQPVTVARAVSPPVPDTTMVDPRSVTAGLAGPAGAQPGRSHGAVPRAPSVPPQPPGRGASPTPAAPFLPPLASPPVPPPRKRRRGLLFGGLGLLVAAGVAVALVLLMRGGESPPGVPTALKAAVGRGTITLTWQPGSGKVDHYIVYRDNATLASDVTSDRFVDKLSDLGPHRYRVEAVAASGKRSGVSADASGTALIRELNGGEQRLIDGLPPALVDRSTCLPLLTVLDSHLDRSVTCKPNPDQQVTAPARLPDAINVYGAPNRAGLNAALEATISASRALPGDCTAAPQHGTWNFTQTPNTINGQIICYVTGGTSYLIWSYDAQLFLVQARTTSAYVSLRDYWRAASLHLP